MIARLLAMQSSDGGWKTDYKDGKPVGLANVETTCLSLLALQSIREQGATSAKQWKGMTAELSTIKDFLCRLLQRDLARDHEVPLHAIR